MAGSSSSERSSCLPPDDFHLSAEDVVEDDDDEQLAINLLKCPLCHNGRRSFYCKQCVQSGQFVKSSCLYTERYKPGTHNARFIEKQQRFMRLKAARNQLEEKCTKALEKQRQRDKLICDISACKERIRLLKLMETKARQNIAEEQKQLKDLKEKNAKIKLKLPKHEEQTNKLIKYGVDVKVRIQYQRHTYETNKQQIKKHAREIAKQLVNYIFPLSKIEPSEKSLDSSIESLSDSTDLLTYALADASGTSYVRGKWVSDTDKFYKSLENDSQVRYRILHPTLPASGDYSDYPLWVAHKDEPTNKGKEMHNPANNVTSALAYTTQLVSILAHYLNVPLPYKLVYKEFYDSEVADRFIGNVARLNYNILYLCLTQNTDPTVLQPRHTLQNVMHLLDTEITDFGRIEAIAIESNAVAHLFNELAPDLEKYASVSSPDDDYLDLGWEAVPHVDCPEVTMPIPQSVSNRQQASNVQVNQSIAGGLVTSAAASIVSMWKGWTNK